MKTLLSILAFLLIYVTQVAAQANENSQAAPTIVKTIPDFGDCQVDSAITQVIVEFDQDMSPGMSLVNCLHMPKQPGKVQWISKRKLAIPVQLNSNQFYQLAFNNSRFSNFKNEAGVSLNPSVLLFKTREINSKEENISGHQKANKLAFEEFSKFFPTQYAYGDLRKIDWASKLSQHKSQLENSTSQLEFALNLYKILSLSEDPHISIEMEGEKYTPYSRKAVTTNFNFDAVFKNLGNFSKTPQWTVVSGKYKNIAYINILNWANGQKEEIGQAIEKLKEFKDEANLIIDVRGNSGGNDSFASEFASCFVKNSVPYEMVKRFNPETKNFDQVQIRKLNPHAEGFYYPGNVYVLTGKMIMSSNESFVLMMKQGAKATTVGMSTYGSSGNPMPLVLSNKVTVHIPSWQAYTLDEKLIEGKGIEPDVEMITSKNDFVTTDAVLEKVVEMINEKSKM